ncbi:MAG: TIGR02757 family protein [Myxococcales bacterium]|nr:TIGR02757 family protein [Myxococcales bacterium]MDH3484054.1 TIGR02757 family protein [Myxococcales bacterium]
MDSIGERLEALLHDCDSGLRRRQDPVDFIHRYDEPVDQEIAGLVASSLAFGNAVTARRSVERVLSALGESPATTIVEADHDEIFDRLRGFVHRIYRDEHLAVMLWRAAALVRAHGSLGRAFVGFYEAASGDFRESMARFADALRGDAQTRNLRHLVSDPRAGSACKRLLLYARWMVRPADGVDLGLWPVAPSNLVIPVDTHIHRISRNLGLTDRRTATWATAEEITAALRRYDPDDPVKYDFALCHLGVSRECPSRPDPAKCERCVLQDVCRVWTSGLRISNATSAQKAGQLRL